MTCVIQTAGRDVGWCPQGFRLFLTTLLRMDPAIYRRSFDSIQEHEGHCGPAIKMLMDSVHAEIVSPRYDAGVAKWFLQLPDRDRLFYIAECWAALVNMPDCRACAEWMVEHSTDLPSGCAQGYSVSGFENLPEGTADWD
jgi:hypothetical protein